MDQETKKKIEELERKIKELERWKEETQLKDRIQVVGPFDGTNVPVLVNGVRRKIATAAP